MSAADPVIQDLSKDVEKTKILVKEKEEDVKKEPIFELIDKKDLSGISQLLSSGEVSVDCVDGHGMTPLMHAAYRGHKEMCQLLIDRGADTMAGCHGNEYKALHFAGLSGNGQVCLLLLQNGAKPYSLNSVGRTAAQMAAFVGNHHCVSYINTFIPKSDVEYFSIARGVETKPKLNPILVTPLYNMLTDINFHPVRIAISLRKNPILLDHIPEVASVTSLISEAEMKRGNEGNEIVAIKIHIISYVLSQIKKDMESRSQANEGDSKTKSEKEPLENFMKKCLRVKGAGEVSIGLDTVLREAVRAFPFVDTTILHQLGEDPGAWQVINGVVNGQKGFRDMEPCTTCGEERGAKKCARCSYDAYCDQECQKIHWFMHKKYCKEKAKEKAK